MEQCSGVTVPVGCQSCGSPLWWKEATTDALGIVHRAKLVCKACDFVYVVTVSLRRERA